jgi:hypothetical protein
MQGKGEGQSGNTTAGNQDVRFVHDVSIKRGKAARCVSADMDAQGGAIVCECAPALTVVLAMFFCGGRQAKTPREFQPRAASPARMRASSPGPSG